jgi:hypothetical protein
MVFFRYDISFPFISLYYIGGELMWKIKLINSEIISELQCEWGKIPNVPIEKFYYTLKNDNILCFEGFESYICFKEVYKFMLGACGQLTDTINILAKYNNDVCQISYNLLNKKPLQRKNVWGKEFTPLIWNTFKKEWDAGVGRLTNRTLWKAGVKTNKPGIQIVKNII